MAGEEPEDRRGGGITHERALSTGRIVKVAGPVVDIEFPPDALPEIHYAVEFDIAIAGSKKQTVVAEVAQHLGDSRVRAIAMKPTDGLIRGAVARNTGAASLVPVGPRRSVTSSTYWEKRSTLPTGPSAPSCWPIHRPAPAFEDLATK